jgi:hypothetical protein
VIDPVLRDEALLHDIMSAGLHNGEFRPLVVRAERLSFAVE